MTPTQKDIEAAKVIVELYEDKHIHGQFLAEVEITNPAPPYETKTVRITAQGLIHQFLQEQISEALAQVREEGRQEGLLKGLQFTLSDLVCDQCGSTDGGCSYCKMD